MFRILQNEERACRKTILGGCHYQLRISPFPPQGGGIGQFAQIKCCSIAGQKEHAILTILRQIQPSPNSTIHKTLFSPFVQVTKVF